MMKLLYCQDCIYFKEEQNKNQTLNSPSSFRYCVAFPTGIPADIFWNKKKHDRILEEQEGKNYFHPKKEMRDDYIRKGYSFEGFENPEKQKENLKRQQELNSKLISPPIEYSPKEDLNWIKQNIKMPKIEIKFLMFPLDDYEAKAIEEEMLATQTCTIPITLWKPEKEYLLVGGKALLAYQLCLKHDLDFTIKLLEFSDEIAVKDWITHEYYTNPNTSEQLIEKVRTFTKNTIQFLNKGASL